MESAKPTLLELQRWVKWAVTESGGVEPAPVCLGQIDDAKPLSRRERLRIYGDGYLARIVESIQSDFETLSAVLGHADTVRLTEEYLRAHPSTSGNIGEVGRHLGEFLESSPSPLVKKLVKARPYLPDLARFEWALMEAFFADDKPPFDPSSLAQVKPEAWPHARFVLDASMRFLEVKWPVHQLRARRDSKSLKGLKAGPRALLVHRNDFAAEAREVTETQRRMLLGMNAGDELQTILEEISEREPSPPPVMEWFGEWIRCGLIRKVIFR